MMMGGDVLVSMVALWCVGGGGGVVWEGSKSYAWHIVAWYGYCGGVVGREELVEVTGRVVAGDVKYMERDAADCSVVVCSGLQCGPSGPFASWFVLIY